MFVIIHYSDSFNLYRVYTQSYCHNAPNFSFLDRVVDTLGVGSKFFYLSRRTREGRFMFHICYFETGNKYDFASKLVFGYQVLGWMMFVIWKITSDKVATNPFASFYYFLADQLLMLYVFL